MADDLVFPEDDLMGDFDTNLEDLLNIPQLVPVPPLDSMQHNMQRNYANMQHHMNNMGAAPQTNNSSYRPITQLMKQTQELASTLGSPLSSSLNQRMNYNNIVNTSSMLNQQQHHQQHQNMPNNIQNRLIGNNMNYVNHTANQQKSSQYLVVGGQRIPTQPQQALPQHQQSPTQHLSQSSSSPLHAQGSPIFDMTSPSSLQQQHQNSFKAMSPSSNIQQPVQKVITTNNQPKKAIVLTTPQQTQQVHHQPQLAQNIQQPKPKQTTPPQLISTGASNNPLQQNGVIIKTADQKLMFVTEVNGKKVGYVLPNQKQPSSPNPSVTVTVSTLSATQSNLQQQQPVVQTNIQKPVQQAVIQNTQKPIQQAIVQNTQKLAQQTISQNIPKLIPQALSQNVPKAIPQTIVQNTQKSVQQQQSVIQNSQQKEGLAPSLDSIKPSIQKDSKDNTIKPAVEKTLKERLQGLRNNVNNANLRTQLNLNKEKNEKLISQLNNHNALPHVEQRIVQVHTVTQQTNNPVSKIISDFDNTFNNDQSPPPTPPTPTSTLTKDNLAALANNKPAENMSFLGDEEDGQDLDFSESDLTAIQEDSDEPMITSISVPKQNEIEDVSMNNNTNNDDEDSDSLPLSLLKHEEPISIVRENNTEEESSGAKPAKRSKKSDDSVPLSVVAASLKKDARQEAAPKPRKKRAGRKKKDPDEPTKPILAYQLFFREAQQRLKEENPMYKENFGELSRKIGKLWEELDPEKKKVHRQNYQKEKAEYDIKLKEYKEKKALEEAQNEALSPSTSANQNSRDGLSTAPDDDDEDAPLKKTSPSKKGAKKKTPATSRPKLTATTIATSSTLSPPLHNFNEESNDSVIDQAADGTEVKRKRKYIKKTKTSATDSPSPPSTDTEGSESEEDDAISRIKELAAKAKKTLKKIEKQTSKGKGKGKVVKMEVETVSTNIQYDPSPKKVEANAQPETMETDQPKHPEASTPVQEEMSPPRATVETPASTPTAPEVKGMTAKNLKATTKEKVKVKEKASDKVNNNDTNKDYKTDDSSIPPLSSPPPKASFKIPKKAHGENGQVAPQGPRLCVRESCPNPIKVTRERGAQYCSNDCLVLYCREVFDAWVIDRQKEEALKT
ncbi:inner centromere protein A-like [Clytia hemisphaerica]|uniref:HMG box domain-containing protein n=1 Tax=Clytia hemisphaerica TaxID=252671 RepID=A0A7M5UWW1_9CNID|eukprot:TCONS_00003128-protein